MYVIIHPLIVYTHKVNIFTKYVSVSAAMNLVINEAINPFSMPFGQEHESIDLFDNLLYILIHHYLPK